MRGGVSDSVPPVRSATGPTEASFLRLGQLPRRSRHHDGAPQPSSPGGGGDRRVPAARHRRIRARDGASSARRLLEDEGPRHRRTGTHREPGSGRTTLPVSRGRQRLAGRWRPRAAHDRGGRQRTRHASAPRRRWGGTPSARGRGPGARAGGSKDQARTIRASGSSGCRFALSIRSIGWPSNRRVPGSSRPCTCGTCFRSSRPIEPRRGATKSPARRRASLVASESGQSVPAQSSTSRCASSRVLPYFF